MSSEVCGDPVASSRSKLLGALNSRYTCIHEPLPAAAVAASSDRYLTSLWVFGNREVEESQSPVSASLSNLAADQNIIDPQRIKEKVTAALKVLSFREPRVLVQFWSPVVVRNRWLLTTVDQPFGLGVIDEGLYMYRLESEQRMHVVDGENREELGPLGRVYRQKLPEWALDINDISVGQHLQDQAASHNIHGYINLPVFEPDNSCVGVLELITSSNYVDYAFEVQQVSRALKGENLKSPNVLEDNSFYAHVGDGKRQIELDEIFQALKMVCDIHNLPLAQTWGPCGYSSVVASTGNLMMSCSSFSKNCIGKVCMSTAALPFYVRDLSKWGFHEACGKRHLDKSQGVVGRSLSSRGLCFYGDVSQLGEEEYPLVPYARMHGITGCLAIYLKSIEVDDEYVVELFLPTQSENEADLQSLVKTVKQQIKNASKIQLGDMSSIQHIGGIPFNWILEYSTLTEDLHPLAQNEKNDFDIDVVISKKQSEFAYMEEDNQSKSAAAGKRRENHIDSSNEPIRKRKMTDVSIGLEEISKHFGKPMEEAAHSLCVSRSTLKRICRSLGIHRWTSNATNRLDDPTTLTEHGDHLFPLKNHKNLPGRRAKPKTSIRHKRVKNIAAITEYAHGADQWPSSRASMEEVCDNFITNTVSVNVKFKDSTERFTFLLFDGLSNLEHKVAKRFKLEGQKICLKYIDEDDDLILICCNHDLKSALDSSRSMNLICLED